MKNLEQLLVIFLSTPRGNPNDEKCVWGVPVNIEGLSGAAKTARIEAATEMLQLPLQTMLPAACQAEDFSGYPQQTADGPRLACMLPEALDLIEAGRGVLFIDELSTARPSVQQAALGLVDKRRVGATRLPTSIRIVTAMNPTEYSASGFAIEGPLANRMFHLQYAIPSADEWTTWLLGDLSPSDANHITAEALVKSNFETEWNVVRSQFAGFFKVQAALLHDQPKGSDPRSSGPWPSHRMWELVGRALATRRCLYSTATDLDMTIVEAGVGKGAAVQFFEWLQSANIPTPISMLKEGWSPDPKRLDVTFAALNGMTQWLIQHKDDKDIIELATAGWQILERCLSSADLVMLSTKKLLRGGLGTGPTANHPLEKASAPVCLALGQSGFTNSVLVGK